MVEKQTPLFAAKCRTVREDKGFRLTFFCEICDNGYMTQLIPCDTPEDALRLGEKEVRLHFNRCQSCLRWVCDEHFNENRMMCIDCAPRICHECGSGIYKGDRFCTVCGSPEFETYKKGWMDMGDLFGGLGGLMKGLSGLIPQDDPDVKIMTAQSEVSDLQKQETELYAQVGKLALAKGSVHFPELENKLCLVHENLSIAQEKLKNALAEKDAKEAAIRAEEEKQTCSSCGNRNPDGVKFCQECGAKLGVITKCPNCGSKLISGARFCGECGSKLEG